MTRQIVMAVTDDEIRLVLAGYPVVAITRSATNEDGEVVER